MILNSEDIEDNAGSLTIIKMMLDSDDFEGDAGL